MKKHFNKRRTIVYASICIALLFLLFIGWQLGTYSANVQSVNAARSANDALIATTKQDLRQQQTDATLEGLKNLAENLVNPSAACMQRTSYLGIRVGGFVTFVEKCQEYTAQLAVVSKAAKDAHAIATYTQQVSQALQPHRELDAAASDPKTVADAYARTTEKLRTLQVDDSQKKSLQALLNLFRSASAQTLAIKAAQDIQSLDRFNAKMAELKVTAEAIQEYGSRLQTELKAAGDALQTETAQLSSQ